MAEHYTRNTVTASCFCKKCGKTTQHRIDDRRQGACLECLGSVDAFLRERKERAEAAKKKPTQGDFWLPPAA